MALPHTPAQLKPMEEAARILCKKRGLDPDERMPAQYGDLFPPCNWHLAAEELIQLSMCLTSLKEAAEAQVAPRVNRAMREDFLGGIALVLFYVGLIALLVLSC